MRMHIVVGILATVLASCAPPVTQNQAARIAAGCAGWPEAVLDRVSELRPAGRAPGDGIVLAFRNARSVVVSGDGECTVSPIRVESGNLLRNLPPTSFTEVSDLPEGQNGYYVLMLVAQTDDRRQFIAMKGGGMGLEFRREAEPG